jgi:hypothetical protein
VVGLLLPLALAGVLSVVAVKAAGREPLPVPPAPALPRPAGGLDLPRRRLGGVAIAIAVVVGLAALLGQGEPHAGGDPGGRILADLRAAAAASIPAGAHVLSRQDREPVWASCDGGPSGWSEVGLTVRFADPLPGGELIDGMGRRLAGRGWRLEQSSDTAATWSKPPATGHGALLVLTADGAGTWLARLSAAAEGQVSAEGC